MYLNGYFGLFFIEQIIKTLQKLLFRGIYGHIVLLIYLDKGDFQNEGRFLFAY